MMWLKQLQRFIFFVLATSAAMMLHAQPLTISGRVMDAETGESLAFVNIVINESRQGGATDIDGRFRFDAYQHVDYLKLTYVGYEPVLFHVKNKAKGGCLRGII